jgi:hypothetical protein
VKIVFVQSNDMVTVRDREPSPLTFWASKLRRRKQFSRTMGTIEQRSAERGHDGLLYRAAV